MNELSRLERISKAICKHLDFDENITEKYSTIAQECAEYIVPRKSYVTTKRQEGQKTITFNTEMYDPTAVFANQRMAAGLISHLAPPNSRWFSIKAKDEELSENEAVKVSLAKLTTFLHEAFAASNFYMQLHELIIDLGWAGTGCFEPQAGKDTDLNFKTHQKNGKRKSRLMTKKKTLKYLIIQCKK